MSKVSVNGIIRDATAEEQAEIDARNTEWNNSSVSRKLEKIKQIRLEKLVETDWWVLRGNMSEAQTTYRQSMRDIPQDYSEADYDDLLATDEQGNLTHTVWEKP
jgi:arginine repressor